MHGSGEQMETIFLKEHENKMNVYASNENQIIELFSTHNDERKIGEFETYRLL